MDDPKGDGALYTITIAGELQEEWRELFDGLELRGLGEETLLEGFLPDQAALHGVIGRIRRLGLRLVSISQAPAEH